MSCCSLLQILRMSAVIFKERLLDQSKIVWYIQKHKCYNVDQGHFEKLLQGSIMRRKKNNDLKRSSICS